MDRNSRASSGARCAPRNNSARPAELAEFLRFLLDRGVTTIDTANTYGAPYTVEEFLGKAIREVGRHHFEIITKAGIRRISPLRPDNRIRHYDFSAKELIPSVDRSLSKLGIDHVDALLLHRPDYLMDPDETAAVLDGFIAAGKTRHVGVSNFSPSRLELLASRLRAPIVTNQVEFSPLHLDPVSDGTFDLALRVGHVPMIWSPIGGGRLLTGEDEQTAKIRDAARRSRHPERPCRTGGGGDRLRRTPPGAGRSDHRFGQTGKARSGDRSRGQSARPARLVRGRGADQPDARTLGAVAEFEAIFRHCAHRE